MKAVEQLVESRYNKSVGNHRVIFVKSDTERNFIYHSTAICVAEDTKLQFMVDNGGYFTSSTRRAISAYRKQFYSLSYTEILELTVTKKKRNGLVEAVDQIGATWLLDPDNFADHTLEKGLKVVAHARYGDIQEIRMILQEVEA